MKTLNVVFLALFLTLSAAAQEPPKKVVAAFDKMYPKAENVLWDVTEDGEYFAAFYKGTVEMNALFTEGGTWISTTTFLDQADVPEKILAAVAKKFPDYDMYDVVRIETPAGTSFEATLESDSSALAIVISGDGKILKKETIVIDEE